jgi:hypothetical protein
MSSASDQAALWSDLNRGDKRRTSTKILVTPVGHGAGRTVPFSTYQPLGSGLRRTAPGIPRPADASHLPASLA